MQLSAMRTASLGLTKQVPSPKQVRFGETIYFQNGLEIKPITLTLDGTGKALAERAIGIFEKVGMAVALSISEVATAIKPIHPAMKDM